MDYVEAKLARKKAKKDLKEFNRSGKKYLSKRQRSGCYGQHELCLRCEKLSSRFFNVFTNVCWVDVQLSNNIDRYTGPYFPVL